MQLRPCGFTIRGGNATHDCLEDPYYRATIRQADKDVMKNFKLLFILGLFAVMGLVLLAEEPQGGAQGTPAPAAGARGDQAPTPPGPPPGADGGRGGQGRGGPGGPPGGFGGGRGGGGGKNVQVLGAAPIPETMQSFVQALGLLDKGTCTYYHVEDRASDEKRPKQVARRMITMTRGINGTFPDGQQHVTCYTCHQGSTKPLMAPAP